MDPPRDQSVPPSLPAVHHATCVLPARARHPLVSAIAEAAAAHALFRGEHGCVLLFRQAVPPLHLPCPSRQSRCELCASAPARSPESARNRAAAIVAKHPIQSRASDRKRSAVHLFSQTAFAGILPHSPISRSEISPVVNRWQGLFQRPSAQSAVAPLIP